APLLRIAPRVTQRRGSRWRSPPNPASTLGVSGPTGVPKTHDAGSVGQRSREPGEGGRRQHAVPVEVRAGIDLAAGRDVGMADREAQRVATAQRRDGGRKPRVLPLGEAMPLVPDQLDTDREVVTTRAPEQARDAGMPGAIVAGHELDQLAAPPDEQVRRDTYPLELGERR